MFEHNHRLHEIILSACSSEEEQVWKAQLRERIVSETHDYVDGQSTTRELVSSLALDIKSLGPVFGHSDNLVRRMSVHRAATLGAKTNLTQVIIKNTQAQKPLEPAPTFSPATMTRSQSFLSANSIPTLAPRKAERIRLENALEEVWTKDALPFPGMPNKKVENQIRASANSVMRKLSMASIASNFSRRSPSFSSTSNTRSEDSYRSGAQRVSHGNSHAAPVSDHRPMPMIVNFHSAPTAFLPTDFEVRDTRPTNRRRRLANRTGGVERPTEKPTPIRPKGTRRLSSHISLPRNGSSTYVTARSISHGSNTTILRGPKPAIDLKQSRENSNPVSISDTKSSSSANPGATPPKKASRSKSRILKFWV